MDLTSLFSPLDPQSLTPAQLEIRRRLTVAATYLLDHPYHSDGLLRDHLIKVFGISRTQAYRDIAEVRRITGNIKSAGKEWHRHVANTMALETYNDAKADGDLKARNAAIANYIKINKINREDVDDFNWERMIPPAFEPSPDITVLNLPEKDRKDVDTRREALRKKFMSDDLIIDVKPLDE